MNHHQPSPAVEEYFFPFVAERLKLRFDVYGLRLNLQFLSI